MKVLIVDDDTISRMALMGVLNSCAPLFSIQEACDGQDAWEQLQSGVIAPFMVCSDGRMPRMTGVELVQNIRQDAQHKDLPFVLISSTSDEDTIQSATAAGATDFIVKPFHSTESKERLVKVLTEASAKMMERPAATMQRLKINAERYQAYVKGLQALVSKINAAAAHASQDLAGFRKQLEPLRTACVTLGLWRAERLVTLMLNSDAAVAQAADCLNDIQLQLNLQLQG